MDKMDLLLQKMDSLDGRMSSMEDRMQALEGKATKIQTNMDKLHVDVGKLQLDLGRLQMDAGKLQLDMRIENELIGGVNTGADRHSDLWRELENILVRDKFWGQILLRLTRVERDVEILKKKCEKIA